jgi:prepilin-type N-terminal cleavage/methylation domain-containing protein
VTNNDRGFTLVEVLVAVMVLSVGVTALVGSSAMVTRMVGRGATETRAAEAAQQRVETLRSAAYSTTPRCTAGGFASGGPVTVNGIRERWIVSGAGTVRQVTDTVTHRTARGTHTDVLATFIKCP